TAVLRAAAGPWVPTNRAVTRSMRPCAGRAAAGRWADLCLSRPRAHRSPGVAEVGFGSVAGVSKPRLTIVAQGCELLAGPRLTDLSARAVAGFPGQFETTLFVQVPDGVTAPTHLHGFRIVPFPKYRSWKEYVLR